MYIYLDMNMLILFHIHFFVCILFIFIKNSLGVNIHAWVRIYASVDEVSKVKDDVEENTDGKGTCI